MIITLKTVAPVMIIIILLINYMVYNEYHKESPYKATRFNWWCLFTAITAPIALLSVIIYLFLALKHFIELTI